MTKSEVEAIRAKYAFQRSGMSLREASKDVNKMLDALPLSPSNVLLRKKYNPEKAEVDVVFWIVEQDIVYLLKQVVPIDDESPVSDSVAPIKSEHPSEKDVADVDPIASPESGTEASVNLRGTDGVSL